MVLNCHGQTHIEITTQERLREFEISKPLSVLLKKNSLCFPSLPNLNLFSLRHWVEHLLHNWLPKNFPAASKCCYLVQVTTMSGKVWLKLPRNRVSQKFIFVNYETNNAGGCFVKKNLFLRYDWSRILVFH